VDIFVDSSHSRCVASDRLGAIWEFWQVRCRSHRYGMASSSVPLLELVMSS